jgi:talin
LYFLILPFFSSVVDIYLLLLQEILREFPLIHLRQYASTPTEVVLDFGKYSDEWIRFFTPDGKAIIQLLSGYIEIISKRQGT